MDEWKQMILVANIFSDSTKILEAVQQAATKKVIPKGTSSELKTILISTTIPLIVMRAFACEMYLKSLLSKCGSTTIPKTHNLFELYRNLNKESKNKINELLYNKMKALNSNYKKDLIVDDIKTIAHAFEEWRYFYEKSTAINFTFLNTFYDVLFNFSKRPH